MGILDGKRIVVTGVLTDDSLAYGVAELAIKEGAEVALTGFGRALSLTKRTARKLPVEPEVYELDVQDPSHAPAVAAALESAWGRVDGVLHSIGYAPAACLGNGILGVGWEDVAIGVEVSAYSL
ncbi:MAG TPA: SDR family oxidoreductase, partial [Acidimicrobiales bacterium]|nr:SDR family oxidoreductase [Acidimicrobiales bacterium]